MNNSSTLCLDASIVVRRLTRTSAPDTDRLWETWRAEQRRFVAPFLLRYEVTNALHRMRFSVVIDDAQLQSGLRALLKLPIHLFTNDELHAEAVSFARAYQLKAAYDSHYLALADRLGVELWTSDERLFNSVRHRLNWIHFAR
jgi:predicted nucleic acid-binding protein